MRVLLINSVLARHDAISASVIDMYRMLVSEPNLQVSVFAYKNEDAGIPARIVSNTADLLLHPDFVAADLIIWHFGIFYDMFNALLMGNGHARQVVCFHNVTPKEFVPASSWPTIERSLRQCHHLTYADEVWAVSRINAECARQLGVAPERLHVVPLVVEGPSLSSLTEKTSSPLEILYVGRFVRSKGVLDLIEAAETARQREGAAFRLRLVGNVDFSDSDYLAQVQQLIDSSGIRDQVEWLGTVDDGTLQRLYREAHILAIPSYHEGFCKPVIEGLRCGCIPVGYAAYNLPDVAAGLGRMVPTGHVDALADALCDILAGLRRALAAPDQENLMLDRGPTSAASFRRYCEEHVEQFSRRRGKERVMARIAALLRLDASASAGRESRRSLNALSAQGE
jgi:glycosyltransferase involved in cell wall biosynthesis